MQMTAALQLQQKSAGLATVTSLLYKLGRANLRESFSRWRTCCASPGEVCIRSPKGAHAIRSEVAIGWSTVWNRECAAREVVDKRAAFILWRCATARSCHAIAITEACATASARAVTSWLMTSAFTCWRLQSSPSLPHRSAAPGSGCSTPSCPRTGRPLAMGSSASKPTPSRHSHLDRRASAPAQRMSSQESVSASQGVMERAKENGRLRADAVRMTPRQSNAVRRQSTGDVAPKGRASSNSGRRNTEPGIGLHSAVSTPALPDTFLRITDLQSAVEEGSGFVRTPRRTTMR